MQEIDMDMRKRREELTGRLLAEDECAGKESIRNEQERHANLLSTMAVMRSDSRQQFRQFWGQQKNVGYILILIQTEDKLTRKR
jgi:hypothetical protein